MTGDENSVADNLDEIQRQYDTMDRRTIDDTEFVIIAGDDNDGLAVEIGYVRGRDEWYVSHGEQVAVPTNELTYETGADAEGFDEFVEAVCEVDARIAELG